MAKVGDTSFFRVNIYYDVLNRNGKIIKTEVVNELRDSIKESKTYLVRGFAVKLSSS